LLTDAPKQQIPEYELADVDPDTICDTLTSNWTKTSIEPYLTIDTDHDWYISQHEMANQGLPYVGLMGCIDNEF
jgi:hypothetical protein